jgi:hypothetical protein
MMMHFDISLISLGEPTFAVPQAVNSCRSGAPGAMNTTSQWESDAIAVARPFPPASHWGSLARADREGPTHAPRALAERSGAWPKVRPGQAEEEGAHRRVRHRRRRQGSVALSLCTTAYPLHTRFAERFGAPLLKRQCDRALGDDSDEDLTVNQQIARDGTCAL